MKWNSRIRCALICVVFTALFSLFSFRLVYLQLISHTEPESPPQKILSARGPILDANDRVLAENLPNETVAVDATLIKDADAVATIVAAALDLDRDDLLERIRKKRPYITLKKNVPLAVTNELRHKLEAIKQRDCVIFNLDANDKVLGQNLPNETVAVDATRIKNADTLVPVLAAALDLDRNNLLETLEKKRAHIFLKNNVPLAVTSELRRKLEAINQRKCLVCEPSSTRIYPNGSMLCHVLGFLNVDGVGIQGVESSMEQYLHGVDGYRYVEHDRAGRELAAYRGDEHAPRDGYQVHLTIDLNLQNIVENEIDAAVKEYTPVKATIILMRPDTGEILAMANRPNFDLNTRGENPDQEKMKNRAITDQMEPGSTFKVVTAATALNEGKLELDSIINCENGSWSYGGSLLHDHGSGYGELSVQDILVHSSNIGAAKIALSVGEETFYRYILGFGFGERTGIELPGEIKGVVWPPHTWSKISITRIPMGHEIGVTALQMTVAMAAIANGGNIVTPRIVKSITDKDGKVVATLSPGTLRRVISRETAAKMTNALRGVVSDHGTAAGASVPGFTVAGKTGTAQKLEHGFYDSEKAVVSFSGFMPVEHPAFVCFVVLDEPHTKTKEENYGGKVAGPIFARIAEKVARYLNLEPHAEIRKATAVGQVASTNQRRR